MSLVTEAGYHGWPAFWAWRALPFSASITSSASAPTRVVASEVAAQAMPTHISVRATEDRVEDITVRGPNPLAALGERSTGGKGLSKPTADERQKRKAHGDAHARDDRSW